MVRASLHGLTRAAITRAQGGKFSAGFWSGFASSALAPLANSASTFEGKIAMSAIVGGTASELGGGKFANGAVSAAFVMMYNDMSHDRQRYDDKMKEKFGYTQDPNAQALEKALGKNAENWYNKDTPIVEGILKVSTLAVSSGWRLAGVVYDLGYGAVTATAGFIGGFMAGAGIGTELYYGFDNVKIKTIIKSEITK